MAPDSRPSFARLTAGPGAVAVVTLAYVRWLEVSNAVIVSMTFLFIVLLVAATSNLRIAVITSLVAMLCFNFFFLPPVGTWTITDPQNWVALFAFLAVSLVASNLSAVARARTQDAVARRHELARLFDLSRDVLGMTDSREAISVLARSIARRFDLDFVAIALPRPSDWDVFEAGARTIHLNEQELSRAFAAAQATLEFDANTRSYSGHASVTIDGKTIRLIPLRVGTKPVGLLAVAGRPIEAGTLDTLGGVVAIAIERAELLEERKSAELTRQSEEMKAALLASLGHNLRTPLAAIRVAATNVKTSCLSAEDRAEQIELILAEGQRLTRLFENILEMARIDAGSVATESRWTHPTEIIEAACEQVGQTLRDHKMEVSVESDRAVRLDPRLTALAVAHLLENAVQYSPAGSTIHLSAHVTGNALIIQLRDHGPGIPPADLPHLFERFYRGAAAKKHPSGTGMGLSIAKGVLAAVGGRIWAENVPDGGAQFTITVPAATKKSESASFANS